MRLICPNCDAQYEVPEDAIPEDGRDVQCSSCGHAWFQRAPYLIAEEEEEAALFEPPLPEEEPEEAPLPEELLADLPGAESAPADAPPPRARRAVDESLLAVLREEAEREVQARSREEPRPLEMQGELGLDMAAPAVAVSPSARRLAALKAIEDEASAPISVPKGRDLLPDIEEINSTLRPSDRDNTLLDHVPVADIEAARNAFRSGFAAMVLLAVALVALYVLAPGLTQKVPALAGVLKAYVQIVDSLRMGLDGVVRKALALVQG
ncbi:MJ0042 family finger-like domain-containing protein [Gemmobacter aquatilis]|uniref:MJ0042 family finger-like domain-containing protein n=1 Tax=Gemmobacter aquatilis TaxID=933059 RepID=A0A1H8KXS4_9RHOB|nr:zinc-ribbon domain-containing protein [Gemmobacter aquatilis]SEN97697.1 MJ0042 family finger-like domain-containing protein [Gemmobacter aquatilis]